MTENKQDKLNIVLRLIDELNLSAYQVAKNTNMSTTGVQKIIDGVTKRPNDHTLDAILDYVNSCNEKSIKYVVGNTDQIDRLEKFKTMSMNDKLALIYSNHLDVYDKLSGRIDELEEKLRLSQLINRTYLKTLMVKANVKREEIIKSKSDDTLTELEGISN